MKRMSGVCVSGAMKGNDFFIGEVLLYVIGELLIASVIVKRTDHS